MRLAVLTIAYNERQYIKTCIKNWEGKVAKHLILVSLKPWNGIPVEDDGTYRAAITTDAEVILGEWKTEAAQRTWGLAYLYNYDKVLIVDPDELYTKEDQDKVVRYINENNKPLYQGKHVVTYWKDTNYILDPPDEVGNIIAVDPKVAYCYEHRQFKYMADERDYITDKGIIDCVCHHMSWAKSDNKIKEKISSYSHSNVIPDDWYENVWLKWEPNSDILVRPYGVEHSKVIYKPAPKEIVDLIESS